MTTSLRAPDCYQIPCSAPPSTGSTTPEMYAAWAEQRNVTAAAISSGDPSRPAGIDASSRARAFSGSGCRSHSSFIRSVSILPGATVLTVMPSPATSRESVFAQPTTPGRIAFESIRWGIGSRTDQEVMLTIRPRPLLAEVGQRQPGQPHGRVERQLERVGPGLGGQLVEGAGRRAAGVVDEDVEPAAAIDRRLHGALHRGLVTDVSCAGDGSRHRRRGGVQALRVARHHGHVAALGGQRPGDGEPHPD